jgi:RNA polymerase sigma factor (sigma-70 family)
MTLITVQEPRRSNVAGAAAPSEERGMTPTFVQYVNHVSFASSTAEDSLFGPQARRPEVADWTYFAETSEDMIGNVARKTILSAQDEVALFLRYNYARYRLSKLFEAQQRRRSRARARLMVVWFGRAMEARIDLVNANMGLVLSMAKRSHVPPEDFVDFVSEGNLALLRCVEKFDVGRGFKFSTYACRSILACFSRLFSTVGRYRRRFGTEFDPNLEQSDHAATRHEVARKDIIESVREILAASRTGLSDIEQKVIFERFGILSHGQCRTLAQVGQRVGLSMERVRQVQLVALSKIRAALNS